MKSQSTESAKSAVSPATPETDLYRFVMHNFKNARLEMTIRGLKGEETLLERLREHGFITGEQIGYEGTAPLGEPLLVIVRGATIALRKGEAQCILV